jgi:hypothetical protein
LVNPSEFYFGGFLFPENLGTVLILGICLANARTYSGLFPVMPDKKIIKKKIK